MPSDVNLSRAELEEVTEGVSRAFRDVIRRHVPISKYEIYGTNVRAVKFLYREKNRLSRRISGPLVPLCEKRALKVQLMLINQMLLNLIQKTNADRFRNLLSDIKPGPDAFKKLKRCSGYKRRDDFPDVIFDSDAVIEGDEDIANSLAENYARNNSATLDWVSEHEEDVAAFDNAVANYVAEIPFGDGIGGDLMTNEELDGVESLLPAIARGILISCEMLLEVIATRNGKKSFGADEMPTFAIKRFSVEVVQWMTLFFNQLLAMAYFPKQWKHAIVLMVHKRGKDRSQIKSYRPISQLSSLGKIYEKILEIRIRAHLDENEQYDPNQFGFRNGRSIVHPLARMVNQINSGLNDGKVTVSVFFDIMAAFDTVWIAGLLFKMSALNFSMHMIRVVRDYLMLRTFSVRVGAFFSVTRDLVAGTPQGGVLSATLFDIHIHDIPNHPGISRSNFCDDTNINVTTDNVPRDGRLLQDYVNELVLYFKRWKIKLAPEKTVLLYSMGTCRDTIEDCGVMLTI